MLAIAAFLVSTIGAVFSMVGLTSLFAGAPLTVGLMAGSLEFAKVVTAGFLYRYWGHVNAMMRIYLSVAVFTLSLITSLGIFGYLSNAYQKSSFKFKTEELALANLQSKRTNIENEIKKIEAFIDEVPRSRITKKFELYDESKPMLLKLNIEIQAITKQTEDLKLQMLTTQTEIGPLMYVAEALDTKVDTVAKYLILVFVSVFDPLAICLVFALSLAIRLKEKYRGDEYRIGKLSLTKPVDHRYKKSA